MNKEDILNINIYQYKNKEDCPEYSNGYNEINKHCTFRFYCKNDICSTSNSTGYAQFPNSKGEIENIQVNVCQDENHCSKSNASCFSDKDCLSNKCINNKCIRNENSPIIECSDYYHHYNYLLYYKIKMHCKKGLYEKCEKHSDCASNVCASINSEKNCILFPRNMSKLKKQRLITIVISDIILVIFLITIIVVLRRSNKLKNPSRI
ncbi:hypothetical protein BCR32DRAFT_274748 [Anaeromyces robustus]|uniref:Dickkopf N-terminal cysteine-rich domain-containing protein n=1 Tax=Anaeromyces robustus TaxID=1754192 RepID=A0A1Y1XMY1_9FUNG|nr:hypothetical protein BCR32DRAFT_274748 [Anaeromyces robustus]|eukprot:ORX87117.1 hypothetical protein BCR32DRAFT_274748 [Anaeromyces robustus]